MKPEKIARLGNEWVYAGSRISVTRIKALLLRMSIDDVKRDYPSLTRVEIRAAAKFVPPTI